MDSTTATLRELVANTFDLNAQGEQKEEVCELLTYAMYRTNYIIEQLAAATFVCRRAKKRYQNYGRLSEVFQEALDNMKD